MQTKELPKVIDCSGKGFDYVLKTARQDVRRNGSPMQCHTCKKLIHKGEQYYNMEWRGDFVHYTTPYCTDCVTAEIEKERAAYLETAGFNVR